MNRNNIISFFAGIGIGAISMWFGIRKYYEKLSRDEIESVKETFSKFKKTDETITKTEEPDDNKKTEAEVFPEKDYIDYAKAIDKMKESHKKKNEVERAPYSISPDEFEKDNGYSAIDLTYYSGDGVLADDEDEIIEDIEGTVGKDFMNHFGDYEDDSVFIRNDNLKTDYEILKDNRSFHEIYEKINY